MMWTEWSGFFLLHLGESTWQIALLVSIVWTLDRLTRKAPARWHYLLWMVVLIKVFLPPVLYSPTSLRAIIERSSTEVSHLQETAWTQVSALSPTIEKTPRQLRGDPGEETPRAEGFPVASSLVLAWSLGGLVCLSRYGFQTVASRRLLKKARPLEPSCASPELEKHQPLIRMVEGKGSPCVVGVFAPKILVPEGFSDRAVGKAFELAILHEAEHIRRRDGLWNLAILFAKTVFWFHPLVHYSMQKFCDAREMVIDEKVLASRGMKDRRLYNDLILSLLETRVSSPGTVSGMSACSLHGLKERVRRVGEFVPGQKRVGMVRWSGLAILVALAVPLGAGPDNGAQWGAGMSGPEVQPSTPRIEIGFSLLEIDYPGENLKEIDRILKRGDSVQGGEIFIDDPGPFSFDLRRGASEDFERELAKHADVRALTAPKINLVSGMDGRIQIAPGQVKGGIGLDVRAIAEIESASRIRLDVQSILYDATKTERLTTFDMDGNPLQSDPMMSGNRANVSMSVEDGGAIVIGGMRRREMGEPEEPTTFDSVRLKEWVMVVPVKSFDSGESSAQTEAPGLKGSGLSTQRETRTGSLPVPVEGNTRTVEIEGRDPASIHNGLALSATDPDNPVLSVVIQLLSLTHAPQSDRDFWTRIENAIGRSPIRIESGITSARRATPTFRSSTEFPLGRGWALAANEIEAVSHELRKLGSLTIDEMPILLLQPGTLGEINLVNEVPYISQLADASYLPDGSQRSEVTVELVEVGEVIQMVLRMREAGRIDLEYRHQSTQIRGTTSLTDSSGNPLQGKPVLDERNLFFETQIEDGGAILIGGYRRTINERSSFLGRSSKSEVVDSFVLASVQAHP